MIWDSTMINSGQSHSNYNIIERQKINQKIVGINELRYCI